MINFLNNYFWPFIEWKSIDCSKATGTRSCTTEFYAVDQGSAALIAAVIATLGIVIGWIVSARIARATYRDSKSFDFLLDAERNSKIRDTYSDYFSPKPSADLASRQEKIKETLNSTESKETKNRKDLIRVISHFEYLSSSIRFDLVSENFIYHVERSIAINSFLCWIRNLYDENRFTRKETFLRNLEITAFRMEFARPFWGLRFIAFIFGKKAYSWTSLYIWLLLKTAPNSVKSHYVKGEWAEIRSYIKIRRYLECGIVMFCVLIFASYRFIA